uniref:EGF-like domain-containing protein n=1 Tax=Macrostomum lignano TaxID=282301 RepID=A0A1I8G253_9PLAT
SELLNCHLRQRRHLQQLHSQPALPLPAALHRTYCRSAADYCFTLQPDKGITELPVCLNDGNCTLTYTDPYFNCSCPTGYTERKVTRLRVLMLLALLQLKNQ